MTNCTGAPANQYLESYLEGKLAEDEAQKFEEHYFDCAVCLAQVEALQAVTLALRKQPRIVPRAPIPWPVRVVALGAIAAMLILAFFGFRTRHQPVQPSVATGTTPPAPHAAPATKPSSPEPVTASLLADMTLPAFQAPNLRGEGGDPNFKAGMKAYTSRDCPLAIKVLSQVPATDEDSPASRFYIGICQMHDGDLGAASLTLRAIDQAGDSPQQEAALYYLAQIALTRNDAVTAHRYLARTVSLHGDFERRARSELTRLHPAKDSK
jgi:hypothetical protein